MNKYIIYVLFFVIFCEKASAQEILVQWTGVVRNELLQPVPFAHIVVKKDFRGTVSDPNGMFTIIAFPRDTIFVSCVGYSPLKLAVPNISYDDSKHYIKDIILREDTIMLSELVIFPWRTYKEFKDAFMALELPEDDLIRAYRNIAIMQEQIYNAIQNRMPSPTINFRDAMNRRTDRMMTYGHMYPTYTITNPFAWAQFFQALQNGDFKRKEGGTENRQSVIDEVNKENLNR